GRRLREQRLRALHGERGRPQCAARGPSRSAAGRPLPDPPAEHPLRVPGVLGLLRPPPPVQRPRHGRGARDGGLRDRDRPAALPALRHEGAVAVVAEPGAALSPVPASAVALREADVHRGGEAIAAAYFRARATYMIPSHECQMPTLWIARTTACPNRPNSY